MEVKAGYKQTEVGVIPENWEAKQLGECARFRTGPFGSALHKSDYTDDGIPVVNPMHIVDGEIEPTRTMTITEKAAQTLSEFRLKAGEIIIGRRGDMGRCAVIQAHQTGWLCGTGSMIIRCDNGADADFLQRVLSSPQAIAAIEDASVGTTMINLNQGTLAGLRIQLPPLPEQRAIAETLSDVDGLLGGLERLIAKKRDLKQAAMQQLLTGQTRLPGEWKVQTGYQQTEVGMIPEDWDVSSLSELIVELRGGAPLKPSDFTTAGVKVLPKGAVGRTGWLTIDKDDVQYCSPNYAAAHRNNQVDNSYTIVVLRDLVPSGPSIGLIVQIKEAETFVLAQGAYGFKVNQAVEPSYLVQLSNTRWYRQVMNSIMVGSTQVHITNTAFKSVKIPLPRPSEQRAIAVALNDMDAELAALEQRRAKTRALKQAMMQELLTGRTRLV